MKHFKLLVSRQSTHHSQEIKSPVLNYSRVRDHLANERTYLAWVRTSLGLVGIGLLIARLCYLIPDISAKNNQILFLSLGSLCLGILTIVMSTHQYFLVRQKIDGQTYEPTGGWIVVFSSALLVLAIILVYGILNITDI